MDLRKGQITIGELLAESEVGLKRALGAGDLIMLAIGAEADLHSAFKLFRMHAVRRLAVVEPAWPGTDAWPALLDRARSLQPDWSQWGVTGAAHRAAAAIAEVGA